MNPNTEPTPLLSCEGLSMHFGGLAALDHLDLDVHPGEILGLVGPNGSGKTTFFNVITGIYRPSGGTVRFEGREIQGMGPQAEVTTRELGITRADQDAFAAASHARAVAARDAGRLAEEIVPVEVGGRLVEADEGIRADSTPERLAALRPAFTADGSITAGSASQLSDAGAAGLISSRARAEAAGLEPLACPLPAGWST